MIVTLVIVLIAVIFLAFFVGKNLSNTCSFWFFKNFENLPVSVLVLIAFGCGIICSILFVVISKIHSANKANLNAQIEDQKEKLEKKSKKENKDISKAEEKLKKLQKKELKSKKQFGKEKNVDSESKNIADNES